MLVPGLLAAIVFLPSFIIHFVGNRLTTRRGDVPIVSPTELRVWAAGALVGVAFIVYSFVAGIKFFIP